MAASAATCVNNSVQNRPPVREALTFAAIQNMDPHVESQVPTAETPNTHRRGYPGLAHFMSTSPEAAIFRKFRPIALLNILRLQAELQEMEEELYEIIEEDVTSENVVRARLSHDFKAMRDFQHTSIPEEQSVQYEQIESIGKKLHEYSMPRLSYLSHAPKRSRQAGVAIDDAIALDQLDVPTPRNVALLMRPELKHGKAGWLNRPDGGASFLRDIEMRIWTEVNMGDFMSLAPRQSQRDPFSSLLSGAMLDLYHHIRGKRKEASSSTCLDVTISRSDMSQTQTGFRRYSQERIS